MEHVMFRSSPYAFFARLMLLLAGLAGGSACHRLHDEALVSLLFNNRMVLILKGTYATDAPLGWAEINNNALFQDADDPLDTTNVPTYSGLRLFLDVGEVRLSTKSYLDTSLYDVNTPAKATKFWDNLAPTRQAYCRDFVMTGDRVCTEEAGLALFNDLFDGQGAVYPSTDVGAGAYQHAGVFMRSFFTGFARRDNVDVMETEYKYPGYRSSYALAYDPDVDSGTMLAVPSQLFPLHHVTYPGMQNSMYISGEYIPLGIEVRFNIKENLMLHSTTLPQMLSQTGSTLTYVGISDWRRPHNQQSFQGGNILARARIYYPDFARSVRVSGGTSATPIRYYYAIYYQTECIDPLGGKPCNPDTDLLPLAATPVRTGNDNRMTQLMPGDYKIQCRYDSVRDGYPEVVKSEKTFTLPQGIDEFNISCSCGDGADACN